MRKTTPTLITPRAADLGHGLTVRRLLPAAAQRSVGPFVFFDHAGPVTLAAEDTRAADVRPHPHIGLATVSYLLSGEIIHRDSLGTLARIQPGAVNWMTAGRGITHSERFEH
ncbi:MAG TPA: pirin family protein, partial [Giesbergeria sp.]|nr:pirin family protein [Giesbergeria sp.]